MVGCSPPTSMSSDHGRVSENAVLLWAVVEALEDLPTTPEVQHQYEGAKVAVAELLERWSSEQAHVSASCAALRLPGERPAGVVIDLTTTRNHRQQWSASDLVRLRTLAGSTPTKTISVRLGRTEQSIRSKASVEKISLRSDDQDGCSGPPSGEGWHSDRR